MIVEVDRSTLDQAAAVHAASWQASHRAFCAPEFIALHSPDRQRSYLLHKMEGGSKVYLLVEQRPVGVVSVTGNLIEDLYILPDCQRRGFGAKLLRFAMDQCAGTPTLWILENNADAERLYQRMGFRRTGSVKAVTAGLDEIELACSYCLSTK